MDLSLSPGSSPPSASNEPQIPVTALNLFDTLAILAIVPLLNSVAYPWFKQKYVTYLNQIG